MTEDTTTVPEPDDDLLLLMYRAGVAVVAGEPDPRSLACLKPHLHERVTRLLAERSATRATASTTDAELDAIALVEALAMGDRATADQIRATTDDDNMLVWALAIVGALVVKDRPDRDALLHELRLKATAPEDER